MTNLDTISIADLSNVTGGVAVNRHGVPRVVGSDVQSVGVRNVNVPPPVSFVPGNPVGVVDKGHVGYAV